MYGDRLETTVNAKVEVDAQVAVAVANVADDDMTFLRWGERLVLPLLDKLIDKMVGEGKLIRVDAPLRTIHQRPLPSPAHAPGAAVFDLVPIPPEPAPTAKLTDSQKYFSQWRNGELPPNGFDGK